MHGIDRPRINVIRTGIIILMLLSVLGFPENSFSGMLVAQGKRHTYIADQQAGIVYTVYPDGEWVRFAEGLGNIRGLSLSPDSSLYILSGSQSKLYRISPDGVIHEVRKVETVPKAIFVDRDGRVHFVQRYGLITRGR